MAPRTFKFSTDPELEAKVRDVVGLYPNPLGRTSRWLDGLPPMAAAAAASFNELQHPTGSV